MPERPFDADVIVAGAGPAGAVAALRLAESGRRVLLCDRSQFPRDKACGDGLIADSLAVLQKIGLHREVSDRAQRCGRLRTLSPGGVEVTFDAPFWILPRLEFDHLLFERAVSAGAEFRQAIVTRPVVEGDRVVGVAGRQPGSGTNFAWRAPLTLLATGAAADVLRAFDSGARVEASGFAVRTYARQRGDAPPLTDLLISLERDLLPGYAWAFPVPGGAINVGVGSLGRRRGRDVNLRARLDDVLAGGGRMGRLLGPLDDATRYRGAPLRMGLTGASLGRQGLAVIGEAAGTTYAVTGEGIGKAMESAMLAADLAAEVGDSLATVGPRYAATMVARYASRFRAYTTAQKWVSVPLVADFVASRANKSRWVHDRLTGVVLERDLPNRILSPRSIWRLLTHS